jgi:hypothetical protein
MHIDSYHLLSCLEKVAVLEEAYKLHLPQGGDMPYRSMDFLVYLYNNYVDRPAELIELPIDWREAALLGMFHKHEDGKTVVVYAANMPMDLKRFVVCKELMHALLDNDGYRTMDIVSHVNSMSVHFPDDESHPGVAVQVEFLAEIAAMEFLFPYRCRKIVVASNLDLEQVAGQYGVPRQQVEVYCSKQYLDHLDVENIKKL